MDKALRAKLVKYNKLQEELDLLRLKIDHYLEDNYGINRYYRGFREDEELDIFECCDNKYDIEKINKIINIIDEFRDTVGESPDVEDIISRYKEH